METDNGYDPAVWSQMAEQMGLQGLHIPEEYGGSGFGYVELGIVLEEMGRALLCAPFFSSVVLAANTLIHSGDDAAKQAHLPGIAAGETIATLAFTEPSGKWDESGITMEATAVGRRLHPLGHEELRDRRPHREPDHRRRPHRRRRQPVRRRR
jgi:alkylation response protein AidB-like acyl-CoA dehydrogenase